MEYLDMSHPTWVRGLKQADGIDPLEGQEVAPHVGAWIETCSRCHCPCSRSTSHPTWVRGLKQERARHQPFDLIVAPHVGAWIET